MTFKNRWPHSNVLQHDLWIWFYRGTWIICANKYGGSKCVHWSSALFFSPPPIAHHAWAKEIITNESSPVLPINSSKPLSRKNEFRIVSNSWHSRTVLYLYCKWLAWYFWFSFCDPDRSQHIEGEITHSKRKIKLIGI